MTQFGRAVGAADVNNLRHQVLFAEHHEISENMREEASYRFRVLTLLLAAYGGALAALIQPYVPKPSLGASSIAASAALVGLYLLLIEIRAAEHWYAFERRARRIERQLGMHQWEDHELPSVKLPGGRLLNTTRWTRIFMLVTIALWSMTSVVTFP